MDVDVGLVGRRQRLQCRWLECGIFSFLTAEKSFCMSKDVGINCWPSVGGSEEVCFRGGIVTAKLMIVVLTLGPFF